jgi:hypothetical protein
MGPTPVPGKVASGLCTESFLEPAAAVGRIKLALKSAIAAKIAVHPIKGLVIRRSLPNDKASILSPLNLKTALSGRWFSKRTNPTTRHSLFQYFTIDVCEFSK